MFVLLEVECFTSRCRFMSLKWFSSAALIKYWTKSHVLNKSIDVGKVSLASQGYSKAGRQPISPAQMLPVGYENG